MTGTDRNPTSKQSLLGLSADETREFLRLEKLALATSDHSKRQWSADDERRWLELFEKKHAAAMRPFLPANK